MKKTPLNAWHKNAGAQMVPFGGWEMPVQYQGIAAEHKAVREGVGLFDISHMGQVDVSGDGAEAFLQKVTTNDVGVLGVGRMQYSLLPNLEGGLVDDIIVTRVSNGFFVVVNASNTDKDVAWMKEQAKGSKVDIHHRSGAAMFALQGPKASALLASMTDENLEELKYYHLKDVQVAGIEVRLSRSGYTGEDGFELCLDAASALNLWLALLEAGKAFDLKPIGLGARNTLRLEMGYALYGHEISDTSNPISAGLGWVVKLDKGDFNGRQSMQKMKETGPVNCLVAFEMTGRGIARDDYPVVNEKNEKTGYVTSGGPSPSTGKNIGLAYVPVASASFGSKIFIEVRGKAIEAQVVKKPFVQSSVRKN